MILAKDINPRAPIPKGYGYSYRLCNMDAYRCYPVPINIIVRVLKDLWVKLTCPFWYRIIREELEYIKEQRDNARDRHTAANERIKYLEEQREKLFKENETLRSNLDGTSFRETGGY